MWMNLNFAYKLSRVFITVFVMWPVEETSPEDQERASKKLTRLNSKGLWLKN